MIYSQSAETNRANRDSLLEASDVWLMRYTLPDSFPKLTGKERQHRIDELLEYRRILRNVLDQDNINITWPEVP